MGEGFISRFYERAEDALGVEVIVVPLTGDGYSLTLGGHKVIVLAATDRWFRSNFTLAHELGHLLVEGAPSRNGKPAENAANSFAAELLMPAEIIRAIDWPRAQASTLAQLVWDLGVSTQALEIRLRVLRIVPGDEVRSALAMPTETLLRASLAPAVAPPAAVTARMEYSARRRFPERVVTDLRRAVADGRAPRASLSWVLGLPVSEDYPENSEVDEAHELDVELLDGLV
nr:MULTISPECIES: ImmA/IrrE family metallo-endopeptidase [unclassified Actinomyces]